jgi:Asp-tRNA(Asn)/Glu-tRNA(Gln) amidotransferase B subunit
LTLLYMLNTTSLLSLGTLSGYFYALYQGYFYAVGDVMPKKTSEEKREQAKALIYLNPNISEREIARQIGVANGCAHTLKKELTNTDEYEQVRAQKKTEFINNAWNVVQKALKLAEKRFDKALEDEEALKDIVESVYSMEDLSAAEKKTIASRLKDLQMTNIRDVAIALGTIYDKQSHASGEPTMIYERKESVPELLTEYEQKLNQLKKLVAGNG